MNIRRITILLAVCGMTFFTSTQSQAQGQIGEYLRALGQSYAGWAVDVQKSGCSLPVWHMGRPHRIFLVPPDAEHYGFEAGDYLISVNSERFPVEHDEVSELLSGIPGDADISVTVFRDGDFATIQSTCQDASLIAKSVEDLADSLLSADPDGCLAALDEFEDHALGSISANMTETRQQCQMVSTPSEFRENYAGYLFVLTDKMIEETKYFPAQFAYSYAELQERIETIETLEETELGATLRAKLAAAEEFVENDEPPPEIL